MSLRPGIEGLRLRSRRGMWVATWTEGGSQREQSGDTPEEALRGLVIGGVHEPS